MNVPEGAYILKNRLPEKPSSLEEWNEFLSDIDSRQVALDIIDSVKISTVFLGLDHRFIEASAKPILFETMIFGGNHDGYQVRYATWEEAETGHKEAVNLVKEN